MDVANRGGRRCGAFESPFGKGGYRGICDSPTSKSPLPVGGQASCGGEEIIFGGYRRPIEGGCRGVIGAQHPLATLTRSLSRQGHKRELEVSNGCCERRGRHLRTIETQRVWCVSVTSVPRAKPARRASPAVAGEIWGIGRGETAGRTGSRQGRHSVMKSWAESADHGMTSSGSRFVAAANTSLANASAADASCGSGSSGSPG